MGTLNFLCSLLLLLLISTSQLAKAAFNQRNYFHYFCDFTNRGNYTANSTYATNLDKLLSTLTSNTEINDGFYNFSQGENTNKINAIGLCRGDVKSNECRRCLTGSRSNLTQLCPNQKEAIGWFEDELCMLRYSDRSIFGLIESEPNYYSYNVNNVSDFDQFNQVIRNLLYNLTSIASSGDSRLKYAANNAHGPQYETMYGLVQCTPDLSKWECIDSLSESTARIPIEFRTHLIGGRVVKPSCNMRFETSYEFFKRTPTPTPTLPSTPPQLTTTTTENTSSQGRSNTIIGIAITVPILTVMVLIFICIKLRVRKLRKKLEKNEDNEIEISESLQFPFDTIKNATDNFSDSNKLGQGGFGAVYIGRLSDGQDIAVKRLSRDSGQGDLEFKNEVLLAAKLQHRHLVWLLGFSLEGRERLLVYEFVANKSLDYFIFDETKREQLDWERRYKIIVGIARGLFYLHEDSRRPIIHRDLKASNILLDGEMQPKIADFGMARLFAVNQTQENTNRIVGTYGYMAPEYAMHGQFSVKSDVFSFGVLVLEIVSGHKNSGIRHGEDIEYLLSFVWRNWREGSATNVIDHTLSNYSVNEIMRCIHIGLLCVQENATSRPTMASVVLMLNNHSLALSVPSDPAFYVDSRIENLQNMMQSWEYNPSAQESINMASITAPYPR